MGQEQIKKPKPVSVRKDVPQDLRTPSGKPMRF